MQGLAITSAVFQSGTELRCHIQVPNADKVRCACLWFLVCDANKTKPKLKRTETKRSSPSSGVLYSLPGPLQREARDAYTVNLKTAFVVAMCSYTIPYYRACLVANAWCNANV